MPDKISLVLETLSTVNLTHAPTTRGRQSVLERLAEGLIDELCLVITLGGLPGLLLKAQALVEGIVQLSVSIAYLFLADKGLETLAETGNVAVVLGEWAHNLQSQRGPGIETKINKYLGMPDDERRVDGSLLDELADELVNHPGVGAGF